MILKQLLSISIIKQHVDIDVSHVITSENLPFFAPGEFGGQSQGFFVVPASLKFQLGRLKEDTWHPLPTRVSFAARTSFLELTDIFP